MPVLQYPPKIELGFISFGTNIFRFWIIYLVRRRIFNQLNGCHRFDSCLHDFMPTWIRLYDRKMRMAYNRRMQSDVAFDHAADAER